MDNIMKDFEESMERQQKEIDEALARPITKEFKDKCKRYGFEMKEQDAIMKNGEGFYNTISDKVTLLPIEIKDIDGTIYAFENPYWNHLDLLKVCETQNGFKTIVGYAEDDFGSPVGFAWSLDGKVQGGYDESSQWSLKRIYPLKPSLADITHAAAYVSTTEKSEAGGTKIFEEYHDDTETFIGETNEN